MRKIAFIKIPDSIKKLMIYETIEGVYLFGYDCIQDTSAIWDNWHETVVDAEEYCSDVYKIDAADWIEISEPCSECQHDFIGQIRIKDRDNNDPQWGKFQAFENGKWIDTSNTEKYYSFEGLTGNERLYISGLTNEFEYAKLNNKELARKILSALDFDKDSIRTIVY
jgi:hypothetical protein